MSHDCLPEDSSKLPILLLIRVLQWSTWYCPIGVNLNAKVRLKVQDLRHRDRKLNKISIVEIYLCYTSSYYEA